VEKRSLLVSLGIALAIIAIAVGTITQRHPSVLAGHPDPSCNSGRPVNVPIASHIGVPFEAQFPDGVLVIGTNVKTKGESNVVLHAFGSDCRSISSFGDNGVATVRLSSSTAEADALTAVSFNQMLILGGQRNQWIVGELSENGRINAAFGTGGWIRLHPPIPARAGLPPSAAATTAITSHSGMIYVAGTDGRANCCIGSYIASISQSGVLNNQFGTQGWVAPTGFLSSYSTSLIRDGSGGVLAYGEIVFMGCGGPQFFRFNAAGVAYASFDSKLGQSLKTIAPPPKLLAPVLLVRKQGGFNVFGDITSSCSPHTSTKDHQAAEAILPNGEIDPSFGANGTTAIASDIAASFWAFQLSTGELMFVTQTTANPSASPSTSNLKFREFTANGRLDTSFGRNGLANYNVTKLNSNPSGLQLNVLLTPNNSFLVIETTKTQLAFMRVG